MRTTTLNGMLSSLATNYNRRNKDVRLYELGNVYRPKALPLTELPDERMHFTLGMYGNGDFFDMKGVCEEFFEKVGMRDKVDYDPNSGKLTFIPEDRQIWFMMVRLWAIWERFILWLQILMESVIRHMWQ